MIWASRAPLVGPSSGLGELPVAHLAQPVLGFFGVLGGRRRAAAGGLHIGLDHIELAVAELGHRMNVGVIVDAHAGRDLRHVGVRPEFELRRHRRGVLVDHQRDRSARAGCRRAKAWCAASPERSPHPRRGTGISMAITSLPSFIGRLLKMSWTRPGHGS